LLHYPLLNFFGTVMPGPPDRTLHRVLVFGLALGGALGLAGLNCIQPSTSYSENPRRRLWFGRAVS
jgi:hypothetical protein